MDTVKRLVVGPFALCCVTSVAPHNASSPHKFPAEGESERWRGPSLYLGMINPPPLPHTGSPRNLELIYWAPKNSQSEEAVLWLDITAILHLGDVSLKPMRKSQRILLFQFLRQFFLSHFCFMGWCLETNGAGIRNDRGKVEASSWPWKYTFTVTVFCVWLVDLLCL